MIARLSGLLFITMFCLCLPPSAFAECSGSVWCLDQNDPNPFCPETGGTEIRLAVEQSSHVLLQVLSPDSASVSRTLIDGLLAAGLHSVVWDGRNDGGFVLPTGVYPYRMVAGGEEVIFEDIKMATIDCQTAIQPTSWSRIKSLWR